MGKRSPKVTGYGTVLVLRTPGTGCAALRRVSISAAKSRPAVLPASREASASCSPVSPAPLWGWTCQCLPHGSLGCLLPQQAVGSWRDIWTFWGEIQLFLLHARGSQLKQLLVHPERRRTFPFLFWDAINLGEGFLQRCPWLGGTPLWGRPLLATTFPVLPFVRALSCREQHKHPGPIAGCSVLGWQLRCSPSPWAAGPPALHR